MSAAPFAELPLFVYGTLRRGAGTPLARRLASQGHYLGQGLCRGLLYRVDHYPGWVPGDGWVTGDLYLVPPTLRAALDAYEECGPGFAEPWEYRPQGVLAWLRGRPLAACLYRYQRPVEATMLIASGDFFQP
ncbi:gamma-glutamylcyclotransferase family protein [Gallaecimonas xiamenensis]|uniref:Gamma-glutamylcyclotransferase AIG2-like domain-containing protein n=1 Tax=Gallaecimonas xiamenensis 3-C-1 TaxID=745411 RepID=K2JEL1_9GAMM|nr:gamma-glutamylcyclotransferase family protein [Gallaecimonas xiamenensis]EKE73087.1 hypothetical protein B3C1_10737 [Gallaecimonas xiamenensis 3-C-1]